MYVPTSEPTTDNSTEMSQTQPSPVKRYDDAGIATYRHVPRRVTRVIQCGGKVGLCNAADTDCSIWDQSGRILVERHELFVLVLLC